MRNDQNAFPVTYGSDGVEHGMTLRDYFAAKAMQAFVMRGTSAQMIPIHAYQMADEMMKEREQS